MATQTSGGDAPVGTLLPGAIKLPALIQELGIDVQTAADEIGLSKYYVQQICAGRMVPGKDAAKKIAVWSSRRDRRGRAVGEPKIGLADWMTDEERALLGAKAS